MGPQRRHGAHYHEWPSSTPVLDAIAAVIAAASVVIGGYAALYAILAALAGDLELVFEYAPFFVAIGVANGALDLLRHWRRHHG